MCFFIINIWILELWLDTCAVRSQWPWHVTFDQQNRMKLIFESEWKFVDQVSSKRSWDFTFNRPRSVRWHDSGRDLWPRNQSSSSSWPSQPLHQSWRNPLAAFVRYYTNEVYKWTCAVMYVASSCSRNNVLEWCFRASLHTVSSVQVCVVMFPVFLPQLYSWTESELKAERIF